MNDPFVMALAVACPRHGTGPGTPCWSSPRGLCLTRQRVVMPGLAPTPEVPPRTPRDRR